jgi:hypothetical protein
MLAVEREKLAMCKLEDLDNLFAGRHFDREVIILCVRWYLRFKLSLRDLVEMMAERGLAMAQSAVATRITTPVQCQQLIWRSCGGSMRCTWTIRSQAVGCCVICSSAKALRSGVNGSRL